MKKNIILALGAVVCSTAFSLGAIQNTQAAVDLEIIEELKPIIQAEVDAYNDANPSFQIKMVKTEDEIIPAYQPESLKAAIFLKKAYNLKVVRVDDEVDSNLPEGSEEIIIQKLEDSGYVKYPYEYAWPPTVQYINNDTRIICAVSEAGVGCGGKDWYTVSPEWEEYLNGVGEAYYVKNNIYPVVPSMNYTEATPAIVDSEFEPYQYTFVAISNGIGMFYRSSPTADWVYFGGSQQSVLPCDDYTGEAQKGFAGMICYDEKTGQESTVRVISEKAEEKSGVKTPNTGQITNNEETAVTINSILTIVLISFSIMTTLYLVKRFKNRVQF